MNDQKYIENVTHEIFTENFNYYLDAFSTSIKQGSNKTWTDCKLLYQSLNDIQKEQIKSLIRLVMQDTISSIFAKLDNIASYENQDGMFELRSNNKAINGDLQELFLMQLEEQYMINE